MPYVERRGNSIRVKWWNGEYKLDAEGKPTNKKLYDSASGPQPGVAFQDENEAYTFGLDREYDVRHGTHIRRADANTLMRDYCWAWFDALDLRPKSTVSYKAIINAVIVPFWGDRAVGDITSFEYEAWKKQIRARYSETYAGQVLMVFGMLMDDAATRHGLRKTSPVVRSGRRGKFQKKVREKKRPLEMEALYRLACNAYTVWGYTGWAYMWTLGFTGMRPPGEMFGLRREFASPNWPASDPDPDRREEALERYAGNNPLHALRVQYQRQWVDGRKASVAPKYDSYRTLVVPPFLHEMHSVLLASHDSPWVFTSHKGDELLGCSFEKDYWWPVRDGSPERTGRYVRPKIEGVEEFTGKRIYLLRHGHKEWLDEDGHSVIAVETRMGHEVAGVQGLYSNLTPAMERRIAESLQERWEKFMLAGDRWQPPFPTRLPSGASGEA
jgi:hypothetical protein